MIHSVLIGQSTDDLMNELLETEDPVVTSTFKTTRIINGHSIEQPAKGELDFRISHRFGKINSGSYELWGLDQATIHLSLEYSPLDFLTVGIGRSSYKKTFDGYTKFSLFKQQKGVPVSISYLVSSEITTLKNELKDFQLKHRVAYVHQILIARKFTRQFSLQITPSLIHKNLVESTNSDNSIWALGFGARYKLTNRLSVNAETYISDHVEIFNGPKYYNPLSFGIDLETGGHVFQIMVTNAVPMREVGFITETTGNWGNGDIHLGFNISRTFNL